MRSIVKRALIPLGALSFIASVGGSAHADGRVVHFGGHYVGTASAESRGEAIARSLSGFAPALVSSGVDRFGDGDTIVRYEQAHHGLPVISRGAAVRLSSAGQPIVTVLDLEKDLPASVEPTVSARSAAIVAAAAKANRFGVAARERDAHLVVWPTRDRGARLAWAVVPRVPAGLPTAPRVIVDAQTAEVLEARDLVTYAKARSFEFNPSKTPEAKLFDLAIAPTPATPTTKLTNPFLEATNCIDRKSVRNVDGFGIPLKVHTCDLEQVAIADANGDFVYDAADEPGSVAAKSDPFSEVSIYYHAAKAYTFFRELQNAPDAQVVVDKPLRVVANLQIPQGLMSFDLATAGDPEKPLDTFQNAFFSPAGGGLGQIFQQLYGWSGGALWFGQGPQRDYAYDGDVVYHEFGHAVVDATIKLGAWSLDERGAIDAPGAMNEGLADYFSSAITGDPDVGEYASKDLGAGESVIRTLANEDMCPTAIVGEVHFDSTLFSGALWEARQAVPEADRRKFDAALYKALRTNPGRAEIGFSDLAKLFKATLTTDLPSGATALETAMTRRGILPTCERIREVGETPLKSPEPRLGFAAPGTQVAGVGKVAPGILQFRAALPPTATSLTFTFTSRSGGGGGGSPFGGQATPFKPAVLVKFGKAITWSPKEKTPHDADLTAEVLGSSSGTATIEIPEGTTADSVYLQIVNTGESDGAYNDVTLSIQNRPGEPPPLPPPGSSPVAPETSSGCGCTTPGRAPSLPTVGIFGGLLLLSGLGRLRRRK